MNNLMNSMMIAFSMYSKIPMPKTEWKEENFKYAFAFFPLVGAIIGAIFYGLFYGMQQGQFQGAFFAAAVVLMNVMITGGIHIDGFCDVMDALSSHKDREEKLKIMKDPHVGAFAVIYTAVLLLVQFGAYTQLFETNQYSMAVAIAFVVSRTLSGLAVVTFPCAKNNGLAALFAKGASKTPLVVILLTMLLGAYAAYILLYGMIGLVFCVVTALLFLWLYYFSKHHFGGITGDVAGYFLNITETAVLLIAVLLGGFV